VGVGVWCVPQRPEPNLLPEDIGPLRGYDAVFFFHRGLRFSCELTLEKLVSLEEAPVLTLAASPEPDLSFFQENTLNLPV